MPTLAKPTLIGQRPIATIARLASRFVIKSETGCWDWIGYISDQGYGKFTVYGRSISAHRVIWEAVGNKPTPGLTLDHLCRNRACVNPRHLEEVHNSVNILRGVGFTAVNKLKTHCAAGHPLAGDNLYRYNFRGRVHRYCKKCRNDMVLKHYYRVRRVPNPRKYRRARVEQA